MTAPLFSIIIPTLNRSRTLKHTLRTIEAQKFKDFELIVSDNNSSDNTQEVVEQSSLANLKYINPGRQLSMSRHWEFALSHTSGRYIAFLGDDDGVVLEGLTRAAELLETNGFPEALGGINVEYHWPDSPIAYHESLCRIPVGRWSQNRNASLMLNLLKAGTRNYTNLPMIYRAFVSREVVAKIKAKSGNFFRSCIPDIYASVAVAASIKSYVFSAEPLFIEGVSGDSNGAKTLSAEDASADESFFMDDSIPFHSAIPYAPSIPFLTAESLMQARDAELLTCEGMMLEREIMIQAAYEAVGMLPMRYKQVWDAIENLASRLHLEPLAQDLKKRFSNSPRSASPFSEETVSLITRPPGDQLLQLRMDQFGCENVYDCMILTAPFITRHNSASGPVQTLTFKASIQNDLIESLTKQLHQSWQSHIQQSLQLSQIESKLLIAKGELASTKQILSHYNEGLKNLRKCFKKAANHLYHSRRWKWSRLFTPSFSKNHREFPPLEHALQKLAELSPAIQNIESKAKTKSISGKS